MDGGEHDDVSVAGGLETAAEEAAVGAVEEAAVAAADGSRT